MKNEIPEKELLSDTMRLLEKALNASGWLETDKGKALGFMIHAAYLYGESIVR